ncbi:MAG: DinB family protein [Lentisphaerae bacterium]|nr:DinB family protein [Lentisphaerota bacterium]
MSAVPAADNIQLLNQLMDVIRQLTPEDYRATTDVVLGRGVGGHVRHIYDHYRLLLAGLPAGRVDYEQRARDARLEQDPDFALDQLRDLAAALQSVPVAHADARIVVQSARGADGGPRWCGSTIRRELDFLAMHDVHHHALIALMLRHLKVAIPDGFGVAPATRRHLEARSPCAQ